MSRISARLARASGGLDPLATTDVKVGVAVFLIMAVLGTIWVFSTPLYGVPDEAEHVKRAVMLLEGSVVPSRNVVEFEGGARATQFVEEVPMPYLEMGFGHSCYAFARATAGCITPVTSDQTLVQASTTAGAYQPLFYGLVAPALTIGSPIEGYYAARFVSALAFALLIGAAAAFLSAMAGAFGVAVLLLATTPMALFLGASVNPNGLEIASAIAAWVGFAAVLRHPTRSSAVLAATASVVFAWTRPLSPFLLPCIVAATVLTFGVGDTIRLARRSASVRWALGAGVVATLSAVGWLLAFDTLDSFVAFPDPSLTPSAAARESFRLLPNRLEQSVGLLGWIDVRMPLPTYLAYGVAVVAVLIAGLVRGTWRGRAVVILVSLSALAMPILAEARQAADLGLFWHGRYTLPVAVGAVLCAVFAITDREAERGGAARWLGWLAVGVAGVAGTAHVVSHVYSMARYASGLTATLDLAAHPWSFLTTPGWSPPGPDLLILGVEVVMGLAMPALVVWLHRLKRQASAPAAAVTEPVAA